MKQILLTITSIFILSAAIFAQTPTALEINKPIEREIKAGETQRYQVKLNKGEFLNAAVNQRGVDVVVRIIAPDKSKVAEIDSPNGTQGDETVMTEAKVAGTYLLEIFPGGKDSLIGRYQIELFSPDLQKSVKRLELDSKLLARKIPYGVILPANYETGKQARFPVVYLLHGGGGNYQIYLNRPRTLEMFERHHAIVVTVEGGESFYTDSATVPNDKYESYIISELIPEIDKNFRTVAERNGRAVAGGSMGGYGAIKFGVKYPEKFALAYSWSGAVIAASWRKAGELAFYPPDIKNPLLAIFGDGSNPATLEANDITKLFADLPADKVSGLPFFYLDCGTEDEFLLLKPNRQLSEIILNKKIAHEYREFPGGHNVAYPSRFPYLFELSERILTQSKIVSGAK